MSAAVRDSRTRSAEPISALDERYIANSIIYGAMAASVTLFLEGSSLRDAAGALDKSAIRARIEAATWSAPALRKRLRLAPLGLSAAAWVPVDGLDLDYHVRFHPSIVEEGPEASAILSGRSEGVLDRRRPTWRILFVELASGDVALVFTWHHVMGDASYGIQVLRLLTDEAPSPAIRAMSPELRRSLGRAPRSGVDLLRVLGTAWWNEHATSADRWRAYRSRPFTRRVRRWGARMVRPGRDGVIKLRRLGDRVPPRTSRMVRFDLAEVKLVADRLGGSLNDLTVAATLKAFFDTRADLAEAALLVPISRRKRQAGGEARNVMTAVRVHVPASLQLRDVMESVRAQVRRGAFSNDPVSSAPRFGYATMVPSGETDRYFGSTAVRAVAGWPAGDPRDEIGVLATSYADVLIVAVTTFATTDIDALVASLSATFTTEGDI